MAGTHEGGVLLVDPDPAERDRLRRELEACGWRVCVAEDGAAAVRLCAERGAEFRAALVDLQLPGLQGVRVLAGVGAVAPGLARFAMSSGLAPYAVAAFRRLTRTPLLAKPVRASDLEAALALPTSALGWTRPRHQSSTIGATRSLSMTSVWRAATITSEPVSPRGPRPSAAHSVNLRNGAYVAAGDVTGYEFADLSFGGPCGPVRVFILRRALVATGSKAGAQASPVANLFASGAAADRGGVRVRRRTRTATFGRPWSSGVARAPRLGVRV